MALILATTYYLITRSPNRLHHSTFSESDPPAISKCGSPPFHFISDFDLTSFESTDKQGAVSQIIPPKEVYGEKVFATS